MTILESAQKLLVWFANHESFNLDDDYKELLPNHISETPEADKASVILALDEMVINNMARKAMINKKDYYILSRPLKSMTQNVEISASTAIILSGVLEQVCNMTGSKELLINPFQIKEQDIIVILTLLTDLRNVATSGDKDKLI